MAEEKGGDKLVGNKDGILIPELNKTSMEEYQKETAKKLNIPLDKVKASQRVYIPPNSVWLVSKKDGGFEQGRFFMPYGWYLIIESTGENYKFQPVIQHQGSDILEMGPSDGKITSAHLSNTVLFEALLDDMVTAQQGKPAISFEMKWNFFGLLDPTEGAPTGVLPAISKLRGNLCGQVFSFLVQSQSLGVFNFKFDNGFLGLMGSCSTMYRTVSMHPVWICGVLGLKMNYVGCVLARSSLSCAGVARYICQNAARLPDVIRNDEKFRNILRPETRHKIVKKQEEVVVSTEEQPPKMRLIQLIGTFLLGEPSYRGDADKDPMTAELLALCKKVAKDDPIFVLKLASYVRNTLTFRNTTNFLLACSVQIEECRPFVRTALPKCTNLPTDLLELWDFWRKLSKNIVLPACLKKGMGDKFMEFSEYQLGKYLNAKVPKPQQAAVQAPPKGKKGKGKGKSALDEKSPEDEAKAKAEAEAKMKDPVTRPLTLKTLIRTVHCGKGKGEMVCGVLRKSYPMDEEEFKMMELDNGGSKEFDANRVGEKFRIPVPKTWETQLSEKGNTAAVWEDLVESKALPFMAMLKNLRNILLAGVGEKTHRNIIGRLKSQHQIANSKQTPVKFLSAFEAIDFDDATLEKLAEEAKLDKDYVEEEKAFGTGKEAKKVVKKRLICRNPPTKALLDRYRDGLETAVSLAARNNVPELECPNGGKALVLVDVSGSMDSPLTQGPKKLHESALTPHRRSNGRAIVEGQDMDLEDYFSQSGQRLSRKISVSMTWIGQDLDLSCNVMDKDGKTVCNVSYQRLEGEGAIWHSGDITSAPYGAEEIITVDLDKLPPTAFMMTFAVNSYSGQKFDDIPEAAMSVRDDGLEGNSVEGTKEICAFRLTGTHKAVVACSLIRKDSGWCFRCLNTPQAQGSVVQQLVGKIKKEYDAIMADAATQCKRLVDASLLLALCIRERMGEDKCEIVLFSSERDGNPGYVPLRSLGPKILANVRRCHAVAKTLGRGTDLPIPYLQELLASQVKLDHLILLTDGLISPSKNPDDSLSRWLRSYRARIHPVKYTCIDVLGLGKPSVGDLSSPKDVLISGYSEAVLRYLTQEPGAQLAEIEAIELPPPKEKSDKKDFDPPART